MSTQDPEILKMAFIVVTDVGCDTDDLLGIVLLLHTLVHLAQPAKVAFVLTMLNPADKAHLVDYFMSLIGWSSLIEYEIFLAEGYNTLEDASRIFPNFPPRFGDPYDQLQGIDQSQLKSSNPSPVSELSRFTQSCSDNSIHLLILSPVSMVDFIDFSKINLNTTHMMAGITKRNGTRKIGYNIGVSPKSFVRLCQKTCGKIKVVNPVTCDNVRAAVNFSLVKSAIKLDKLGYFVFDSMMKWHDYITKGHSNFLDINTPCISDLVAMDVFLRKIFPTFNSILDELVKKAIKDEFVGSFCPPDVTVNYQGESMCIDEECTVPYLDDLTGQLFDAQNGTKINFLDAQISYSHFSIENYATCLIAAVFANSPGSQLC